MGNTDLCRTSSADPEARKTESKDILAQFTHIFLRAGLQQVSNKLWPGNLPIRSLTIIPFKAKHSRHIFIELDKYKLSKLVLREKIQRRPLPGTWVCFLPLCLCKLRSAEPMGAFHIYADGRWQGWQIWSSTWYYLWRKITNWAQVQNNWVLAEKFSKNLNVVDGLLYLTGRMLVHSLHSPW